MLAPVEIDMRAYSEVVLKNCLCEGLRVDIRNGATIHSLTAYRDDTAARDPDQSGVEP